MTKVTQSEYNHSWHEYNQKDGCKINLIVKPITTAYESCQLNQLATLKLYNRMKAKIKLL